MTAWRRRAEMPADELPWLLGVARLVLANHARSRRRRDALTRVFVEQASRAAAAPAPVDHDLLRAIAALGPDDREALILVGWDVLRPAEAARARRWGGALPRGGGRAPPGGGGAGGRLPGIAVPRGAAGGARAPGRAAPGGPPPRAAAQSRTGAQLVTLATRIRTADPLA